MVQVIRLGNTSVKIVDDDKNFFIRRTNSNEWAVETLDDFGDFQMEQTFSSEDEAVGFVKEALEEGMEQLNNALEKHFGTIGW